MTTFPRSFIRRSCWCSINRTQQFSYASPENSIKAVFEAEKVVGYPTSFLNLRWLLNDEVSNIVRHIRRLIGTNHPLLSTAKDLIVGGRSPTWGLIVLLVSKAGGLGHDFDDFDKDITAGILHSQRVLAEVTEMIRTSNILHKSVLNISNKNSEEFSDLNFGNTLSLLTGDYLLSSSFRELAILRNQEVSELITLSLRDLVEASFIGPMDRQNRQFPAKPLTFAKNVEISNGYDNVPLKVHEVMGNAKAEWTLRHYLSSGSLLARCCQASIKLANHPEDVQKLAYLLGRNMALAWQAHYDLETFEKTPNMQFSLISAPIMFELANNPNFYEVILKGQEDVRRCDYAKIHDIVNQGEGLDKTRQLKQEFVEDCLVVLENFQESDAKEALKNIVKAL